MQELNLLPTLSVAENLFLHDLPRRAGWIDRRRLRAAAREAMAQVGLEAIDPDTLVGDLGIGHQQMVEIARNLIGDCRLLILDEPTAMLTAREVDMLFEQVERLRERGVAIVYISHRLEELARISQRIAVLRDGRLVCVEPIERHDADQPGDPDGRPRTGRALRPGPTADRCAAAAGGAAEPARQGA